MVTDMLGVMLQELARRLEIPELHPDSNNSCLIRLKNGQRVQLELDKLGEALILGAELGVVPPGRYRENLFKEALKANDLPYPLHGILAYSKKSDQLVLFERVNVTDLTGEKVADLITPFMEKARVWSEAIKTNDIPPITQTYSVGQRGGGIFGLKP